MENSTKKQNKRIFFKRFSSHGLKINVNIEYCNKIRKTVAFSESVCLPNGENDGYNEAPKTTVENKQKK